MNNLKAIQTIIQTMIQLMINIQVTIMKVSINNTMTTIMIMNKIVIMNMIHTIV